MVGLTSAEAKSRLILNGPNSLHVDSQHSTFRLLLRQFESPIILILFVATIISMIAGEITDGAIILAIIIPSGLLGFWQEHRAGKIMQGLMDRVEVKVEVIRDGVEITVPVTDLVVGDLVVVRVGDLVPADLHIVQTSGLMVDESVMTGESFPREKVAGEVHPDKVIAERSTELFLGSHIVSGFGQAVVVKTGKDTEFGALSAQVSGRDITTGFERGTTAFGMLLLHAMLFLVSALFVINVVLHRPIIDSLLFSLALAVGITPQLLPVIISVSLAAGARRMAERQVLVKRLDAIEDFGVMTILCTDKTGTITTGVVNLTDAIDTSGKPSDRVLRLAFLNASSQKGFVNPLDEAIRSSVKDRFPGVKVLDEIAYDFQRRRLSVLVLDSEPLMITKGSFESVVSVCTTGILDGNHVPIQELLKTLEDKFSELTAQGNRVLALATRMVSGKTSISLEDERAMNLEGLLVFQDLLKEDAKDAISELADLGIALYLITGDNHLTAKSIAGQVGLIAEHSMKGSDVAALSDEELAKVARGCRVFAEVDPLQKERIVKALRATGATVGYFGDGINDAAAIHAADVGISVDTAVDVAKHAASIVLLNKDLRVIADGVRLGRRTFVNTMKYVRVGVSAAFGNVVSMAIADIFLPFLPLLPFQILLLNFLTDFPALAISGDSVDEESVKSPSAWDIRSIRRFMITFGLLSSVFDIATFLILRIGYNASATLFRSGWFVESTLTELTVMMVLRTRRRFWQSKPGRGLLWASVGLAVIAISIPFLPINHVIGLTSLPLSLLLTLLGLIWIYVAMNEIGKRITKY
jgi:Mg2+-importing ATPase